MKTLTVSDFGNYLASILLLEKRTAIPLDIDDSLGKAFQAELENLGKFFLVNFRIYPGQGSPSVSLIINGLVTKGMGYCRHPSYKYLYLEFPDETARELLQGLEPEAKEILKRIARKALDDFRPE